LKISKYILAILVSVITLWSEDIWGEYVLTNKCKFTIFFLVLFALLVVFCFEQHKENKKLKEEIKKLKEEAEKLERKNQGLTENYDNLQNSLDTSNLNTKALKDKMSENRLRILQLTDIALSQGNSQKIIALCDALRNIFKE